VNATRKPLYELLPAIYRLRDAQQDQPLAALLGVIDEQLLLLEEDLRQLYDDQFIETCADWVAPYLGDLVGYRPLHGVVTSLASPRAEVANTLRYRRAKGTASMLEQLACDVTGWSVRAVEFFEWLAWNQYMQHPRVTPARGGTLDLRDHDACERVRIAEGAFDTSAHGVDVRSIASGRGRHGLRNVGLFVWRLDALRVTHADARKVSSGFTFHPVGLDAPLFNPPLPEGEFAHLATERNVPAPLRRRPLYDELQAWRSASPGDVRKKGYFAQPVFEVRVNGEADAIPPEQVTICDLEDWHAPPANIGIHRIRVAVDPELGRMTFAAGEVIERAIVSYSYGSPAAIGGGTYDRLQSLDAARVDVTWNAEVSQSLPPVAGSRFATLSEAVQEWNGQPAGTSGAIHILDSASYAESLTGSSSIQIPAGSRLLIAAANETRPHLLGNISVKGTAAANDSQPGALILNGLLIEGALSVLVGNLGALNLDHCTLPPRHSKLSVSASQADESSRNSNLSLTLRHSIVGPVSSPDAAPALRLEDCIVHNGTDDDAAPAIDAPHAVADIRRSTLLGSTSTMHLEARNSLFTGLVSVERRQSGCMGFCYLPMDSRSPRRHRCQPDLELETQVAHAERQAPVTAAQRALLRSAIESWLKPTFTARDYGPPGFGQLRLSAPLQLRTGADDESEMGAFHDLFQPQRESNLRLRLDEYLRFGFEAGVVFIT